jgi:iron complex outermembrane recepter protein
MGTKKMSRKIRDVWAVVATAAVLANVTLVCAQQSSVAFDLPAQSLVNSLRAVGKLTDTNILINQNLIGNRHVPALKAQLTVGEALGQLLQGTGLVPRFVDDKTVVLAAEGDIEATGRVTSLNFPAGGQEEFRVAQADTSTGSATASDSNGGADPENFPETSDMKLEEVVVTAQRREERLREVPIAISVLGGADLERSTYAGVTEALAMVPGVSAMAQQVQTGGTLLAIRGVSAPGAFFNGPSTAAYYVDSVPFGMIKNAVVPDPNIYDLQQIEVLRGPQGTLYGANALNGVVRVLTHEPDVADFEFKGRGLVSTTEDGGTNYGGDLTVNVPIISGKLAARATVGERRDSGWIRSPLDDDINSGATGNYRLKVKWLPTDNLAVDLSAWHSQSLHDAAGMADDAGATNEVLPQRMRSQFNAYGAKLAYELPALSITSTTSYVTYGNNTLLGLTPSALPWNSNTNLASRVIAEELALTSKLESPWRWSAGMMYRDAKDNLYQDFNFLLPLPPTTALNADYEDTSKSWAAFGELGRRFFDDKLQWTLGLRYFQDDGSMQPKRPVPGKNLNLNRLEASASATTPRAVLTWLPNEDFTAYASYSEGFRSGELQGPDIGATIADFPASEPDKLANYELGVKGQLWSRLVAYEAAVFHMQWSDIQQTIAVFQPDGDFFIPVFLNAGDASGSGIEFTFQTRSLAGFSLGANFSWNDLEFDDDVPSGGSLIFRAGERPHFSPEYTAALSAQYSFALGANGLKGTLSASGNYLSPMNGMWVPTLEGDSLLLMHGSFTIDFADHWSAALFVDNAGNYDGTQQPFPGIPQYNPRLRPRTYGLRFNYYLR